MSPDDPPFQLLSIKTGGFATAGRIHRIKCGRFCCRRQLGPTTAEPPTRTLGDNYGAVTDERGATVALFHPSAAAHASLPTRGSRLKRRAPHRATRTGPHSPRLVGDWRTQPATPHRLDKPLQNIPLGDSLPSKEINFEALLIRGSKPGPSRVRKAPQITRVGDLSLIHI